MSLDCWGFLFAIIRKKHQKIFAYLNIYLHLYYMKMQQKDIIDTFRITRAVKSAQVFGHFDIKEAMINHGGQFVDMKMADGKAVTISMN
jgi:hypothetical protein